MGYYFYYPTENKIFVAMYAEFFESNLISQEASRSIVYFDEIQRQDEQPLDNASEHQPQDEYNDVDPQTDVNLVRRSARIPREPERYGFYINDEEHELGYHDDLPPECKTVRSKLLFKKKTDMDGNIHTYKACLVAKGFTQTYRVDYEETFSHVADIKAIRILIARTAYYDYEICQMDVKTAFLNGRLNEDVYMVQPEGASESIVISLILYVDDILLMGNNIPMLQDVKSWLGKCFAMKYLVRCTRPNVAFSQNLTSRYQQNSGESHWTFVKNILKYLRNTKDMLLVYGGDSTTELSVTCYTDASWEADRHDLRSQMGYVFVMNEGAIDWKFSKQSTTAMSSMEAEYIVASEAAMEAIWLCKFIVGLALFSIMIDLWICIVTTPVPLP
uniref:Reverse transcriptase Ty1/copia-type domain-containing protein n=1 Tax=Tanacetum cinerariifolium TaxID=118510 RepID=A0A699GQZ8_TANCI|nr:hypothetical protein [Tanacetum cinerariifolium]